MTILLYMIAFGLIVVTSVQVYLWLCVYQKVASYAEPEQDVTTFPDISVVICARNAISDLQEGVPQLLAQNYCGSWQLIIVDDASTDGTASYLQAMAQKYQDRLTVVTILEKTQLGKKQALDAGIKAARFEWILVSDADCRPASAHWIHRMAARCTSDIDLVLGFGPMQERSGWLPAWQQYEACYTAMQYFGWALSGMPYMGVGRNMAYRKTLYTGGEGFSEHLDLPSGDDDLLVNATAQVGRVGVCLHPESFMFSAPKMSWHDYARQKARHFSTSPRYQYKHQWVLSIAGLSHSLHFFFMLLLLLAQWGMILVLLVAVIRILILIRICRPTLRKFHADRLQPWLIFLDPFVAVYYTVFVPGVFFNTVNKPRSWT
jgi:glycosyltransferase involved in cell wall biosynthesis